jgi:hypothetical protein
MNDTYKVKYVKELDEKIKHKTIFNQSSDILLGTDNKFGNILMDISETIPAISIRPAIAIALAICLLRTLLTIDDEYGEFIIRAINKLIYSNEILTNIIDSRSIINKLHSTEKG